MSPRLLLPGGKASVTDLRSWLKVVAWGSWLFGPMYVGVVGAARSDRFAHRAQRAWASAAIRAAEIELDVTGLHHVDPGSYVVAPLHEGFADALVLHQLPLDFTWAVRDELFAWRMLGPFLRASRQIFVPTHDGRAGYRALLRAAPPAVAAGRSIVVFPQGSILGIEAAFQQGAFRLARAAGIPLLPVVITGTHRVWEHPYGTRLRLRQRVRLHVMAPVPGSQAVSKMSAIEREMKEVALAMEPQPRRFEPSRDGWWDDYPYAIDPAFADLAARVRKHRADSRAP